MNYTENYHLPQWNKADRVLMEDFNQAMSALEAGLSQNAGDIAAGLERVGGAASQAAAAAQNAQSTANSALGKANAAYSPSAKPYAAGTYVGNGNMAGVSRSVSVGFQPSAVLVCSESSPTMGPVAVLAVGSSFSKYLAPTSNGFTVTHQDSAGYPQTNLNGITYCYIAFR